jgi:hypothetical protein
MTLTCHILSDSTFLDMKWNWIIDKWIWKRISIRSKVDYCSQKSNFFQKGIYLINRFVGGRLLFTNDKAQRDEEHRAESSRFRLRISLPLRNSMTFSDKTNFITLLTALLIITQNSHRSFHIEKSIDLYLHSTLLFEKWIQ